MRLIIAALFALTASFYVSATEAVSTGFMTDTAIGGIDTVAYHSASARKQHQVTAGKTRFSVKWNDAYWYFASQKSADRFAADPERYRPEYNGHCSNALSHGEGLIPTDGQVWEFFDDKLHLFYAERGRQRWLKGDWQQYKQEADKAWEQLKQTD